MLGKSEETSVVIIKLDWKLIYLYLKFIFHLRIIPAILEWADRIPDSSLFNKNYNEQQPAAVFAKFLHKAPFLDWLSFFEQACHFSFTFLQVLMFPSWDFCNLLDIQTIPSKPFQMTITNIDHQRIMALWLCRTCKPLKRPIRWAANQFCTVHYFWELEHKQIRESQWDFIQAWAVCPTGILLL